MEKELTLTNEWQSLSTLLGNDYDNTKKYRIHSNLNCTGFVCFTANNTLKTGSKIKFGDEIYNDAGINLYLKVSEGLGTSFADAVVIGEVA